MTVSYTASGAAPAAEAAAPPSSLPDLPTRSGADGPPPRAGLPARLWCGREQDPRWARPLLLALLAGTAVLYLVDLGASGYANSFYSAAVQAGSESWKAFFFGSSDAGSSITVDKPPASLWVMALSVRIFGLSSWAVLVPQALMGVGTVWLLHDTVRRALGAPAGLLAGLALAVTPVAALMFRFNNPDALLVLLMVGAAYAVLRAVESARTSAQTRWLLLAGALVGFGFLTKQLQVFLVVPALGLTYLLAGRPALLRRVGQLLLAGVAVLVSAGWWVAIVELWPAASRPYIGGSTDNSFLGLTFGYNGLGRLTGDETGSVGGAGTAGSMWGETGLFRLFGSAFAGQIAWLAPAALVMGVVALWLLRGAPRTSALRAQLVLWTGWLLTTWLVFSFMSGIFHAYYTVALAPAVAGLAATGAVVLWRERATTTATAALAAATAGTAVWSFLLLSRSSDFLPGLRWAVLVLGVLAAAGLVLARLRPAVRSLAVGAATAALVAGLAGPAVYAVDTATTPHTGSIVSAGPTVAGSMGGPGGMRGMGGTGGMRGPGAGGFAPGGQTGQGQTGQQGGPTGAPGGQGGATQPGTQGGTTTQGGTQGGFPGGTRTGGTGGMGGLLNATTPSAELTALLRAGRQLLPLGRRDHRRQQRRRLPARHPGVRDADRRLQRHRRVTDPGAVPGVGGGWRHPLLHRQLLLRRRPGHHHQHRRADQELGGRAASRSRPWAAPPSTT